MKNESDEFQTTRPFPYVSPLARAYLAQRNTFPRPEFPHYDDLGGWRAHIKAMNAAVEPYLKSMAGVTFERMETGKVNGVTVYHAAPPGWDPADKRVLLHMHGGALYMLAGEGGKALAAVTHQGTGLPIVSVEYRMPPDDPFPAGLQDCVTVYEQLVLAHGADNIVVAGESAGGNLAAATILKSRDQGLPLPVAAVLLSPEVDLTERGDTFTTLESYDALTALMPANLLYAGGAALDDPYVSPLFGDFSKGFPPTLLQSGTRDLLLSNAVNLHRALRRAGVEAHLHVWEAMSHGRFGNAPEEQEIWDEVRQFLARCFRRPAMIGERY